MIDSEMGTQHFKTISENPQDAQTILLCVYHALSAKGYDPITQIVGYLISGDPTYITGYQNARSLICRIDRDELLEELVQFYLIMVLVSIPLAIPRITKIFWLLSVYFCP